MARLYCIAVALLLLAEVSRFGEGASNPGFVVRITGKGLEYGKGRWLVLGPPLLPSKVVW